MQSSRDSSVWRSLAVAFGDGLAFGVGMKLTQSSGRSSTASPQPDLNPVARRLEEMEQRLAAMEQTPRSLAAPEKPAPAPPFDQKVLEAIVGALDARLHEHAGQVERQIKDLEAKVTIELETLHNQDRSIAKGVESRTEELRAAAENNRRTVEEQISALHHDVADVMTSQLEAFQQQILLEVRQSVGNVAAMAASAADSAIEDRMAPLRALVEAKDREIAELKARLAGTEEATLDLLQGVGEICRRTATRFTSTQSPPPPQAPPEDPKAEPPEPPAAQDVEEMESTDSVPDFAPKPPGRLWRVPLVSSMILTTGAMLMHHFL